jgi:ectoine hydroxylase-related dioxygenase (phytanoyl-CoA dioxygenase family)
MASGDIVFFRPNTVHWSGPNLDGSVRRGFNCFYTGDPFRGMEALGKKAWKVMKRKRRELG